MATGAQARLLREAKSLSGPTAKDRTYPQGFTFTVEDYVSVEESEGGNAFYWGSTNGGINNVNFLASDVEQVKTAEEMAARPLPTPQQLAVLLGSGIGSFDADGFELVGADYSDGDGTVEFDGLTADGLPFSFAVQVTAVSGSHN